MDIHGVGHYHQAVQGVDIEQDQPIKLSVLIRKYIGIKWGTLTMSTYDFKMPMKMPPMMKTEKTSVIVLTVSKPSTPSKSHPFLITFWNEALLHGCGTSA